MIRTTLDLAEHIAGRLGEIEGVEAVALGGSWARGEARADSDVDLGIYYRDEHRPPLEKLDALARKLGYRNPEQPVTDFGGWGPWINGGGWLQVAETPVDWLYRDLGRVSRVIDECRAGKTSVHYQPGHPHGFHTHVYMGEIHYCVPLYDPNDTLKNLKGATETYPPRLGQALAQNQLWEARFSLDTCRKPAARGDAFYVSGCLFRCAACMTQALFALNGRYLVNEKGSAAASDTLPLRPPGFVETVNSILAGIGRRPEELMGSIRRLETLLESAEGMCAERR
ncbi:MAG: nucleotidyltransferase domain-containing protein [Rubrobacter sp.]